MRILERCVPLAMAAKVRVWTRDRTKRPAAQPTARCNDRPAANRTAVANRTGAADPAGDAHGADDGCEGWPLTQSPICA